MEDTMLLYRRMNEGQFSSKTMSPVFFVFPPILPDFLVLSGEGNYKLLPHRFVYTGCNKQVWEYTISQRGKCYVIKIFL